MGTTHAAQQVRLSLPGRGKNSSKLTEKVNYQSAIILGGAMGKFFFEINDVKCIIICTLLLSCGISVKNYSVASPCSEIDGGNDCIIAFCYIVNMG